LTEKKNGKWRRLWDQGGLDAEKSYNIKFDGRTTLWHITPGNWQKEYTPLNSYRISRSDKRIKGEP